jgi:hypothetical protein
MIWNFFYKNQLKFEVNLVNLSWKDLFTKLGDDPTPEDVIDAVNDFKTEQVLDA